MTPYARIRHLGRLNLIDEGDDSPQIVFLLELNSELMTSVDEEIASYTDGGFQDGKNRLSGENRQATSEDELFLPQWVRTIICRLRNLTGAKEVGYSYDNESDPDSGEDPFMLITLEEPKKPRPGEIRDGEAWIKYVAGHINRWVTEFRPAS